MKKRKIIYLAWLLALSIFATAGCQSQNEPRAGEARSESKEDGKLEESKEKKEYKEKSPSEKKSEEDKKASEEKLPEDKKDTDLENKKDTSSEDKEETAEGEKNKKPVEIKSDEKEGGDKKAENTDKPVSNSSSRLNFNDNETENLKKAIKKLSVTLIEDDNQEHNDVDLDKVEAIAIYEDDSSYGWICKYDDNKIGVAQVPHETIYEDGEEYHPVQIVKIWGEKHIYEGGASGIKNNDPELFKAASKEIAKTFHFDDGLQIKLLFD